MAKAEGVLAKVEYRGKAGYTWERFLKSTTLVMGYPKVGKTTFVATLGEDVLIIETEPGGADYVEGAWVVEVHSLKELKELWRELSGMGGGLRWKVVAIDTITQVSSWIEREVALEYGKAVLGGPSVAYGMEYAKHRAELIGLIKSFQALPCGLILVAHARIGEGDRLTLSIPGRLASAEVLALASNVIYLGLTEAGEREAVVRPGLSLEAGTRDRVLAEIGKFPPDFRKLREIYEEVAERVNAELRKAGEAEEEAEAEDEGKGREAEVQVRLLDELGGDR